MKREGTALSHAPPQGGPGGGNYFWLLLTLALRLPASDQVPGKLEEGPVALVGGTIYPVESAPIENGTLVFAGDRITALGRGVDLPAGARIIDVAGKRVYPAMIECATQIGLIEIGAVRASRDTTEIGELNPNVRALVSINPDSELIPVTRANGVALAAAVPAGGLISGSSALIRLDGWTWEEMAAATLLGIHVRWPRMTAERSGRETEEPAEAAATEASEARRERDRRLRAIQDTFADARAYLKARAAIHRLGRPPGGRGPGAGGPPPADLRLEALLPVVSGKCPVYIHADLERDIRAAVAWARTEGLRPILVGGAAAPAVASFLKENDVPVIYGPVHALPGLRDQSYDEPFSAPARLHEAGVKFAIASFETSNARNLPYHAAMAAAHGLPPEEALRAITLYPARILGVADRYGSLAAGKSATIMVTDGDPLEIVTHVERLWIDGRPADLASRHTRLYQKYSERIRRQPRKF